MSSPRRVVANQIESPALPVARISVDPSLTYIGGPSFRLYGIAHAEQHLFVEADSSTGSKLIRVVWVQFP